MPGCARISRTKRESVQPRNLFDASIGEDNILKGDRYGWSLRLTGVNIANKYTLYNFPSTFSGTHYVTPRALSADVGFPLLVGPELTHLSQGFRGQPALAVPQKQSLEVRRLCRGRSIKRKGASEGRGRCAELVSAILLLLVLETGTIFIALRLMGRSFD
jgi:hypothetical protein